MVDICHMKMGHFYIKFADLCSSASYNMDDSKTHVNSFLSSKRPSAQQPRLPVLLMLKKKEDGYENT